MSLGSEVGDKTGTAQRELRRSLVSQGLVPYVLATADAFAIQCTSILSDAGYQLAAGYDFPSVLPLAGVGLIASFVYILRMSGGGHYDFPECAKPHVEIGNILVCWLTTGLLLAFFAFLLKVGVDYSRGAFILFYFSGAIALLGVRKGAKLALAAAISRGRIGSRDTVLVGDFDEVAALKPQDMLFFCGKAEVNCFPLGRSADPNDSRLNDERILKSVINFVQASGCREILLVFPWTDTDRIEFVRETVKILPIPARLLPDKGVRSLTNYSGASQPTLTIEVQRAPLTAMECFAKRLIDVVVASVALIIFAPVMLFTAFAIKLDGPGPIIFRQRRKGFSGQQFVMLKFRTMTVQEDGDAVSQVRRNDPRVTSIGRVLRATSIDELPQLINVLKGDMSLIGPRPHALAHDYQFQNIVGDYAFRHHVKPGLTGWAQCNGARGATPSVEEIARRVQLDLWYINNWSLLLDLQILIKTFFEVLRKRNAY